MHEVVFALQIFLLHDNYVQHYTELGLRYKIQAAQNRYEKIAQVDWQTFPPKEESLENNCGWMLDSFDLRFWQLFTSILTGITEPQHAHERDRLVTTETELQRTVDGRMEGVLHKVVEGNTERVLACVRELEIRDILTGVYKGAATPSLLHQVISSTCAVARRQEAYSAKPPPQVELLTADQGLQVRLNANLMTA